MGREYLKDGRVRCESPILPVTRHFYPRDTELCTVDLFEHQEWYHGIGVAPLDHPGRQLLRVLDSALPQASCAYCQSPDVLVVALQGCVHPQSGDVYYDFEIVCRSCEKFTAYSYAEN